MFAQNRAMLLPWPREPFPVFDAVCASLKMPNAHSIPFHLVNQKKMPWLLTVCLAKNSKISLPWISRAILLMHSCHNGM